MSYKKILLSLAGKLKSTPTLFTKALAKSPTGPTVTNGQFLVPVAGTELWLDASLLPVVLILSAESTRAGRRVFEPFFTPEDYQHHWKLRKPP
ncbi:hypothetical protein R1flu_028754 [Riccia fluitans]|uniref:Uncharacterized protein n=1 Tax=Riccia fluitans TaxID=41844 RepID=A0ABD1XQK2_9MARC